MSKIKPGMPSPALTEDDVRRIVNKEIDDVFRKYFQTREEKITFDDNDMLYTHSLVFKSNYSYESIRPDLPQDTTGDQVECTDTQAEWVNSPTAD